MNISYNFDTFDDGKKFRLQQAAYYASNPDKIAPAAGKSHASAKITENSSPQTEKAQGQDSDWSFWDFIDLINPLQHIPIVNSIYREITGDQIKAPAKIIGGALFGGAVGAATSIANAILEESSGKDVNRHMLAMFEGEETPKTENIHLASAEAKTSEHPVVEIHGKNFTESAKTDGATVWQASHAMNGYAKAASLK